MFLIEQLLHLYPDNGSGLMELAVFVTTVSLLLLARVVFTSTGRASDQ